jgi:hypothetical protein
MAVREAVGNAVHLAPRRDSAAAIPMPDTRDGRTAIGLSAVVAVWRRDANRSLRRQPYVARLPLPMWPGSAHQMFRCRCKDQ